MRPTLKPRPSCFAAATGIAEVLVGDERGKYDLNHPRAGEVILVSTPNSWQAYYWWLDDARAPKFARTVDIHRKPGYDPVEMHLDMATKIIPLDATLVKGSHGAPPRRRVAARRDARLAKGRAGRAGHGRHRRVRAGACGSSASDRQHQAQGPNRLGIPR